MKEAVIDLPAMFGDHHVLRVRAVLLEVAGIDEVTASAAKHRVTVRFDDTLTSLDAIHEVLASQGYPPGHAPVVAESPKRHEDGSAWYRVLDRKTNTDRKDREMAGDFRRY
jgi:copper chaperone CopZ